MKNGRGSKLSERSEPTTNVNQDFAAAVPAAGWREAAPNENQNENPQRKRKPKTKTSNENLKRKPFSLLALVRVGRGAGARVPLPLAPARFAVRSKPALVVVRCVRDRASPSIHGGGVRGEYLAARAAAR